jgi:DNA (cytosine-5)-methyltransferase 1
VKRFESTEPGKSEPVSRCYRLLEAGLSTTLRAGTDRSRGSFTAVRPIHPLSPRCITSREAARLHSIPDWFEVDATKWRGFMQIGNSVPPKLANAVARSVREVITG